MTRTDVDVAGRDRRRRVHALQRAAPRRAVALHRSALGECRRIPGDCRGVGGRTRPTGADRGACERLHVLQDDRVTQGPTNRTCYRRHARTGFIRGNAGSSIRSQRASVSSANCSPSGECLRSRRSSRKGLIGKSGRVVRNGALPPGHAPRRVHANCSCPRLSSTKSLLQACQQ